MPPAPTNRDRAPCRAPRQARDGTVAAASTCSPPSAPRSTRQARPISQLKPEDVIFYDSPANHDAIDIGNGNVVHAATTGQTVTIDGFRDIGDINSVRRMVG